MGGGRIVHLPDEKKSGEKWMIKIMGFIQIVHLSKEKKRGVKWIVQVAMKKRRV